jgi:SAM-dependent methyltransferase
MSERPNSYLLDTESPAEMARLINLDQMTTRAMGGPLGEQALERRAQLRTILDMGYGPGGWVLDAAFTQPESEVAGVDISKTMIAYANARARSQGISNASFEVMNIMKPLDFAAASFDLVNARFLFAALPEAIWPSFLSECMRLLRPGASCDSLSRSPWETQRVRPLKTCSFFFFRCCIGVGMASPWMAVTWACQLSCRNCSARPGIPRYMLSRMH